MLGSLASGEHVRLVSGEKDLSCSHLYVSGSLGKLLCPRAKRDKAKPEDAASDLNIEPVRLCPGCEGRLGFRRRVLARPPVVLCPAVILRQSDEVGAGIEKTLMASFTVGPCCDLLLVSVCDDSAQQRSEDGYGGRNDP
ncbi:hypothetical protein ABTX77_35750 [Streptomyces sp. NPDC097704]|uniref:hypothetical protein n=1 Tax=Streptomyces sp. NPDC097704 TaxID=3157101 RepID=UPI00332E68FC